MVTYLARLRKIELAITMRLQYELFLDSENKSLFPEGLLGVGVQHEADHLDGKLMVDYISSVKRQRIRSKLLKMKK